jgi:hypothetical protein
LEERALNPERLNLDRRQLTACPILENEARLRLLNYQVRHEQIERRIERGRQARTKGHTGEAQWAIGPA